MKRKCLSVIFAFSLFLPHTSFAMERANSVVETSIVIPNLLLAIIPLWFPHLSWLMSASPEQVPDFNRRFVLSVDESAVVNIGLNHDLSMREREEILFSIIRYENSNPSASILSAVTQEYLCESRYEFLRFFILNEAKISEEYKQVLERLANGDRDGVLNDISGGGLPLLSDLFLILPGVGNDFARVNCGVTRACELLGILKSGKSYSLFFEKLHSVVDECVVFLSQDTIFKAYLKEFKDFCSNAFQEPSLR